MSNRHDDDTDALLRSLESRASGQKAALPGDGGDDDDYGAIETYLAGLEEEGGNDEDELPLPEAAPPIRPAPAVIAEKAVVEEELIVEVAPAPPAADGEHVVVAEEAPRPRQRAGVSAVEKQRSQGFHTVLNVLKWILLLVPLAFSWWLVGALLGEWFAAGWLVALVASLLIFGLPALLILLFKRGRYVWWAAGLSLVLLVALLALIPERAGNALARYGHWPAYSLLGFAGWEHDAFPIRANAVAGETVGNALLDQRTQAYHLGTDRPLTQPLEDVQQPIAKEDQPEAAPGALSGDRGALAPLEALPDGHLVGPSHRRIPRPHHQHRPHARLARCLGLLQVVRREEQPPRVLQPQILHDDTIASSLPLRARRQIVVPIDQPPEVALCGIAE